MTLTMLMLIMLTMMTTTMILIMLKRMMMKMAAGYLPAEEVKQLSTAYSTVFNLGLDGGSLAAAINMARSVDIRHGLVNIEMFIHCVLHSCYK